MEDSGTLIFQTFLSYVVLFDNCKSLLINPLEILISWKNVPKCKNNPLEELYNGKVSPNAILIS